ncbi:MAG: DegV family protein [Prevotella sp.]|nr:DegV family protein [Prevotella sp.]
MDNNIKSKIKLVVDSASDIDQQEAEQLGVTLVPMEITFGGEQYLDGVTLSHNEFFNKLVESNEFPKTSQINSQRFTEVFTALTKDGSDVLCILISSKLSGTYNSALAAAKNFGEKVWVVDSLNVCIGERILIQYALQLMDKGLSIAEIVVELNHKKSRIQLVALLNTLKYLQKGGRISKMVAFAGTLMNVKPVIGIIEGEVKLTGKALGSKKGNNLLVQQINKSGGIDFTMPYATAYSGFSDHLLQKYLADSGALWQDHTDQVPTYMIGSTIGAHAGPDAIAVAYFSQQ